MPRSKKIAIVYTKDPLAPKVAMDLIRWHSMSAAMAAKGFLVDMVSPSCQKRTKISKNVTAIPLNDAPWKSYAAIKTCYQRSIPFVPDHPLIISRLARVVGPKVSSRDHKDQRELLDLQKQIAKRSKFIFVNDEANRQRWLTYYGDGQPVHLVPTGCPSVIPDAASRPVKKARPSVIYLGSLNHRRIIRNLNRIGSELKAKGVDLIVAGPNKTKFYYKKLYRIDEEACKYLGAVPQEATWELMRAADVGLAIAPGPNIFENEISKLYFYLRTGLPVACEDLISNLNVVTDAGWGKIFHFGDVKDAVAKILSLIPYKKDKRKMSSVIADVIEYHSWDKRADLLAQIIKERV